MRDGHRAAVELPAARGLNAKAGNRALNEVAVAMDQSEIDGMIENARRATNFLKALSHEGRLLILCYLASQERSVTELEDLVGARQAAVSQQLARLRLEGLVKFRREGKTIYYSLSDDRARRMIDVVHEIFCAEE